MSQKLALESMQLARGKTEESSKHKKKKAKASLIEKQKEQIFVDNTVQNVKNLLKKDYRNVSKLKSELLCKLSDFKAPEYISLKQRTSKKLEDKIRDEDLDRELDAFIADFFKESSKNAEPYKSEGVKKRERRKEIQKQCSVKRLPGCGKLK